MPGPLGRLHDRISRVSFQLAQLGLVVITASYAWEVVVRYFFAAPTSWSNEVAAYALCISVSLALPEVTRARGHIAIDFVLHALPGRAHRVAQVLLALLSGAVCLIIAAICLRANLLQVERAEMLVRVNPIPKVLIAIWLTYAFFSAGLHFLRHAADPNGRAEVGLF